MNTTTSAIATASDVRTWANNNGHTLPARGRIPFTIIEKYNANNEVQYVPSITPERPFVRLTPVTSPVLAEDVRAWAILNGFANRVKMTRGRLPLDVIDAYNANHETHYVPATENRVKVMTKRTVTDKNGNVRTVPLTKTVAVSDVRAWAVANGLENMARGRMHEATFAQYILTN